LLLSLLALLLLLPFVPQNPAGVAIFLTGVCAVLVTGVVAAGVTRRRRALALGFAIPTVVCLVAYSLTPAPGLGLAARLTFLAFHVYITWSLLRTLLDHRTVQRNTLYGAVCTYLLVGVAFVTLYAVLEAVHPPALAVDPARQGSARLLPADIVFFSFMTLTTVGYGDITPISAEARLVAVFEAVAGVFFLAFLVARLVVLYRAEED
jgi:D-alanyl-lipoteichoic acid acyltransferase DltB (MBOAT superfamily)